MESQRPLPTPDEMDPEIDYIPRRAERLAVDEAARLAHNPAYDVEVKVRNLSPCGFMAECDEKVGIGSFISLDIPGLGPVQAQIRWQIGARMGGMFTDPISLKRCEWTARKRDD